MMEGIRRYLFSLAAAALLCAMVKSLAPKGKMERVVSTLCGVFLAMTALSPLAKWSLPDFAAQLSKVQIAAEEAKTGVENSGAFTGARRGAACVAVRRKENGGDRKSVV